MQFAIPFLVRGKSFQGSRFDCHHHAGLSVLMLVLKAEKTAPCGTVFDDRRDPDPHQLALVTAAAESIPGLSHLTKKVRPLRSAPG